MEEKEVKKNEETINVKAVAIIALGAYIIGSFVGATSNNKKIAEAYNRGVLDTVTKFVFNNK